MMNELMRNIKWCFNNGMADMADVYLKDYTLHVIEENRDDWVYDDGYDDGYIACMKENEFNEEDMDMAELRERFQDELWDMASEMADEEISRMEKSIREEAYSFGYSVGYEERCNEEGCNEEN